MGHRWAFRLRIAVSGATLLVLLLSSSLLAKDKKDAVQYGTGLIINIPSPEAVVVKAVEDVVRNGLIRGTKEYAKDEHISGATVASDSKLFPAWSEGGKVFYKVRFQALDPRNFKDSNDVGTVAVRYVVMPQDEGHTVLRIDAVFVEDFRRTVHPSDGSVEGAEYKDIHDHIESMEMLKQQTIEAEKAKQETIQKKLENASVSTPEQVPAPSAPANSSNEPLPEGTSTTSIHDLEQKVAELRKQAERKVRSSGAPLKAAPYHTAGNLESLKAGAEVLVVITTPYWYGVETHEGQHGWMSRDDLEELP